MKISEYSIFGLLAGLILVLSGCGSAAPSSVELGTSMNGESKTLSVSGIDFHPNSELYMRVFDSHPFSSAQLTFLLQKKSSAGWLPVVNDAFYVNPQDQVQVMTFNVAQAGDYKVTVLDDKGAIASNVFTAK